MSECVLVFAGTIEGREITKHLLKHGVEVCVCVATEYGASLYEKHQGLTVSCGRMDREQMEDYIKKVQPRLIIDATHPYASQVTKNIRAACGEEADSPRYLRLLRGRQQAEEIWYADTADEAADMLERTTGKILLTTGSKELAAFTKITDYKERCYARVLSLPGVVSACADLGFEGAHLFCMQGPFSQEMNEAMLRQTGASILVTKDTGEQGGFAEKYRAAKNCGARVLVIGRPAEETGLDLGRCKRYCAARLGYTIRQHVTLVGIGMGDDKTITREAREAIQKAQLLVGAPRMIEAAAKPWHHTFEAYKPEIILQYLREHPEYEEVVIALSGDAGFFSGAKKLLEQMEKRPDIVCGISSMAYFCGRLGRAWEEVTPLTMHGRETNLVGAIGNHEKLFCLMGTTDGIGKTCRKLQDYGYGELYAATGENLAYENEKISEGIVSDFVDIETEKLCVLYLENPRAKERTVTHGIPDAAFLRDRVPMTKEEVRSISLSKLRLRADSVVYDVGAGSGSVAVEMALQCPRGQVFAVEKKAEAVSLIRQNRRRFAADNLTVIEGMAPEALDTLPVPTHAFIGGSSGNLKEIMERLLCKNPKVRVVINAITLETVAEAVNCLKELSVGDVDIAQVSVARSKDIGSYHMMMGQNPVYVISCEGGSL